MAGAIQIPTNPRQSSSTQTPAAPTDQELRSTSGSPDEKKAERRRLANSAVQTKNEVSGGLAGGLEDFFRKIANMPDRNRQTVEKALKGSHHNPKNPEDRIKIRMSPDQKKFEFQIPTSQKDLDIEKIRAIHVVKDGKLLTSASRIDKEGKGQFDQIFTKDGKPLITSDCDIIVEQHRAGIVANLLHGYYSRTNAPLVGRALGMLPDVKVLTNLCVKNRFISLEEGLRN